MTARYLIHATLDTADMRRSPRSEVGASIIAGLQLVIDDALGAHTPIPGLPGLSLHMTAEGQTMLATVSSERGPIITYGVAVNARGGGGLWRLMHRDRLAAMPPLATDPDHPPSAPWCAARIEVGAALAMPDTMMALGDFGRCLAWAWIARWERAA